jgi:hypothetical protein
MVPSPMFLRFFLASLLAGVCARASVYEYTFSGTISSRQVPGGDTAMKSTLDELFPNNLTFHVSLLIDVDTTPYDTNNATSAYRLAGSTGTVRIGSADNPVYLATINSTNLSDTMTVHNDNRIGTTAGGDSIYVDGFNIDYTATALTGATLADGAYRLHSMNISLSTPEVGGPAPDVLTSLAIPTSVDASAFQYRSFAFSLFFTQDDPYVLGSVRGGLGGVSGDPIYPNYPSMGTIPNYTVTIAPYGANAPAVPEPSTYALLLGAAAFGVLVVRRHRRG